MTWRKPCGTFFCAPPHERNGHASTSDDMVIWTVRNLITEIQTLDPSVDAVLRQLFP